MQIHPFVIVLPIWLWLTVLDWHLSAAERRYWR